MLTLHEWRRPLLLITALATAPFSAEPGTYHLSVEQRSVNVTGNARPAVLVNGKLPAPTLRWREGEEVTLYVTNRLSEPTSIHWHGILLPYQMDGVPGISFPGIAPGTTFIYRFPVLQNGTYWYHGHSGLQEQAGLYGALLIDPQEPEADGYERDHVIVLSDWTDERPARVLTRLKKQSNYYNFQQRTVVDFFRDLVDQGFRHTVADRLAWGQMRMDPTDLADVTGYAYSFLINGRNPEQNWTGLFRPGDRVRLRFINASAMTHFDVRVPGLAMRVIQADGQDIAPLTVDEFRIAVAETYDVVVEPKDRRAYSIFAEAMDRSGYARGTLAPRYGMRAAVPSLRTRRLVTLGEMGGTHGAHRAHPGPKPRPDPAVIHESHAGHRGARSEDHASPPRTVDAASHHDIHAMHAMHGTDDSSEAAPGTLGYRDLRSAQHHHDWRKPDREIVLKLTGNMFRYIWSFDDKKYAEAEPIRLRYGERVRFTYVNETMMNHPIHLHGMWQDLDNGLGPFNPRKHVVNVGPGETVSVDVTADAPGSWAFHCHLLYHMESGMFREVVVERDDPVPHRKHMHH
ncbi:MAG: copper resistance system multicopper oxidase [Methylotetracoccus sp.]|nr:copper resistance system multicopper oxidase [Methylotetracoccus sp.]